MRKIDFEKTAPNGLVYRDCLYVADDESDDNIELMKTTRYANWLAAISVEGTPVVEEPYQI